MVPRPTSVASCATLPSTEGAKRRRASGPRAARLLRLQLVGRCDDLTDQTVLERFRRGHPEVPTRVLFDPLERLAGLLRNHPIEAVTHLDHLFRFDSDVHRLAADAARGLMKKEPGV